MAFFGFDSMLHTELKCGLRRYYLGSSKLSTEARYVTVPLKYSTTTERSGQVKTTNNVFTLQIMCTKHAWHCIISLTDLQHRLSDHPLHQGFEISMTVLHESF